MMSSTLNVLCSFLLLLLVRGLSAQVCDVNWIDTLRSSTPREAVSKVSPVGSGLLYTQYDAVSGTELWRTSGAPGSEQLVLDIWPDQGSSYPGPLYSINGNIVFFFASHPDHGRELWRSDGTTAGTNMVLDAIPGEGGSSGTFIGVVDGILYYKYASQYWRTNGTAAGTYAVTPTLDKNFSTHSIHDLSNGLLILGTSYSDASIWSITGNPGEGFLLATDIVSVDATDDHIMYIVEEDGIYVSDGSLAGTQYVYDDSDRLSIYSLNDIFIFGYYPTLSYDPATQQLDTIANVILRYEAEEIGGLLVYEADDLIHGDELWGSDGTEAGTYLIKDINPTADQSSYIAHTTVYDDIMYFFADDGIHGDELWRSDGTESGTYMVKDIAPGPRSSLPSYRSVPHYMPTTTKLYFELNDTLHFTNGTLAGTQMITDVDGREISNIRDLCAVGDILYFSAYVDGFGDQVIRTDGTRAGTGVLTRVPTLESGYAITWLSPYYNGGRYGEADVDGRAQFVKVTPDTVLFLDTGYEDFGYVKQWVPYGGELYARIYLDSDNDEIIKITNDEEVLVLDWIHPDDYYIDDLYVLNDLLFVECQDKVDGHNLLISTDGTPGGTAQLHEDSLGIYYFKRSIIFDDHLYSVFASALWKTDGTIDGTTMVDSFDQIGSYPFLAADDFIFFEAYSDADGVGLWRSDGTEAGTYMIKAIPDNYMRFFKVIDNVLYFTADDGINGDEVWQSDGTEAGTHMVVDDYFFGIGLRSIDFEYYSEVGGKIYFNSDSNDDGLSDHVIDIATSTISEIDFEANRMGAYLGMDIHIDYDADLFQYVLSKVDTDMDTLIPIDTFGAGASLVRLIPDDSLFVVLNFDRTYGYQLYTLTCIEDLCPESSTVTGTIATDRIARAATTLTVDAVVQSPAVVQLYSGQSIDFEDPLQIDIGAILEAAIAECPD